MGKSQVELREKYNLPDYKVLDSYKHLQVVIHCNIDGKDEDYLKWLDKRCQEGDSWKKELLTSYGIFNTETNDFLVPFGIYSFIDKFDRGLVRVKQGVVRKENFTTAVSIKELWGEKESEEEKLRFEEKESIIRYGIINMKGEVVVPLIYDRIWSFVGKNYDTIVAVKDDVKKMIKFSNLDTGDDSISIKQDKNCYYDNDYSYNSDDWLQDAAGTNDDETMNDVFWNLD